MRKDRSAQPGRADEEALEKLKQRFEEWRRGRERRSPIPPVLLKAARVLVGPYRPATLAKILGLHYRHTRGVKPPPVAVTGENSPRDARDVGRPTPVEPTFVKIPLDRPRSTSKVGRLGMVEFENPRGFKARIFLGEDPSDLVCELLKAIGGGNR